MAELTCPCILYSVQYSVLVQYCYRTCVLKQGKYFWEQAEEAERQPAENIKLVEDDSRRIKDDRMEKYGCFILYPLHLKVVLLRCNEECFSRQEGRVCSRRQIV